ncbi:hypothetical protein [Brachybacterium sp. GPGPB12]|uniref:hypothetical protein n=1 Tax=Brachybacterium sp. GPGPB12 TaxID=3023517 RepID=UPI0031342846
MRPLLDLSERRALVAANDPGTDPDIVLTGARHLARMRNFRSAAAAAGRDRHGRAGPAGRVLRRRHPAQRPGGARADQLLAPHLGSLADRDLTPAQRVRLAEWIQLSGLPTAEKVAALRTPRTSEGGSRAPGATLRDLRFREFRLRTAGFEKIDVRDFFAGGDEDPFRWKDNLRYVHDLVTHGHADTARTLLERRLSEHGPRDRAVAEAAPRASTRAPSSRTSTPSPPSTAACRACSPSPTTCGGRVPRTRTSTKRASRRRPPASTPWTCTPATLSCACSP